jgi:hypothetical protein
LLRTKNKSPPSAPPSILRPAESAVKQADTAAMNVNAANAGYPSKE